MIFETFSSLWFCLASKKSTTEGLSLVYLVCWLFLITKKIDFEIFILFWKLFFLLILFSIRKIDHRWFVLVCLVCSLNLEFLKELWRGKTLDFRNLFIIMILKSLCYSDNLFLLILFSIRRVYNRRFLSVYLVRRLIFENNLRELWSQKQLVFETFHHYIL